MPALQGFTSAEEGAELRAHWLGIGSRLLVMMMNFTHLCDAGLIPTSVFAGIRHGNSVALLQSMRKDPTSELGDLSRRMMLKCLVFYSLFISCSDICNV